MLANYHDVPENLINAIVQANATRKDFLTQDILGKKPKTVGVYRLVMQVGSDNFRESSILGIVERLKTQGVDVIIDEPLVKDSSFSNCKVVTSFYDFVKKCDLILANRFHPELEDVKNKVHTRDLFELTGSKGAKYLKLILIRLEYA